MALMSRMDSYIGRTYAATLLFVSLIFIAIIGMISLMNELSAVQGEYRLMHALGVVAVSVLQSIYQLFPIVSMLAAILALGHLAAANELTVLRASGVSVAKMMTSLAKAVMLALLAMTLLGEGLLPSLAYTTERYKVERLNQGQALSTQQGTWVRHGHGFTHFDRARDRHTIEGVTHYQFDQHHRLVHVIYAQLAKLKQQHWQLQQVAMSTLQPSGVKTQVLPQLTYDIGVSVRAMKLSKLEPELQSLHQLRKVIAYRAQRDMDTQTYLLSFWQRLAQPVETLLLSCLVVPFVLGSIRSATMGKRLLLGVLFGFAFYVACQCLPPLAMAHEVPVWLAALLPAAMLVGGGGLWLRRFDS